MENKMMDETIQIKSKPSADGTFWRGLGGHFNDLTQIMCEFIDNSLSDFMKNPNSVAAITIHILRHRDKRVTIQINDNASGIEDLDSAFEIGSIKGKASSLNEHGFGMKHALASANPGNDNWRIITRTKEDAKANRSKVISAPYKFEGLEADLYEGSLIEFKTGTRVEFTVAPQLFQTLVSGLPGNYKSLSSMINILGEDLGYVYCHFIKENIASLKIIFHEENEAEEWYKVKATEPMLEETIAPGHNKEKVNLGNGLVTLEYEFGKMSEHPTYKKHYRKSMSTSGVEIRINGRLLASNLFKDIWGIEKHNSYNYLLVKINVVSNHPERLPKTTTSKTGLRQDDEKLALIYRWIREKLPNPRQEARLSDHEIDLFNQLKLRKKPHLPETDIIELEQYAYKNLGEKIRIDLYLNQNGKVTIYEGKKDKTTPKDVYQLMMYWDGLIYDGINPKNGILLASEHPNSVKEIIKLVNTRVDDNGDYYNFSLKTWKEEGIDYPN